MHCSRGEPLVGSFSEDRPLGWDPAAAGSRAGDGMARFVSEEKAPSQQASSRHSEKTERSGCRHLRKIRFSCWFSP